VRGKRDQFRCVGASVLGVTRAPARFDAHVAAIGPTRCLQCLRKCREARLSFRIGRREVHEHADAAHLLAHLLRTRRKRPRHRGAAESQDKRAAVHSITSSARASNASGTVKPSALAVFILMISSKWVGCSTGRSAGWAPLRILSTYTAALRNRSG